MPVPPPEPRIPETAAPPVLPPLCAIAGNARAAEIIIAVVILVNPISGPFSCRPGRNVVVLFWFIFHRPVSFTLAGFDACMHRCTETVLVSRGTLNPQHNPSRHGERRRPGDERRDPRGQLRDHLPDPPVLR
jgi:hypothetical protein